MATPPRGCPSEWTAGEKGRCLPPATAVAGSPTTKRWIVVAGCDRRAAGQGAASRSVATCGARAGLVAVEQAPDGAAGARACPRSPLPVPSWRHEARGRTWWPSTGGSGCGCIAPAEANDVRYGALQGGEGTHAATAAATGGRVRSVGTWTWITKGVACVARGAAGGLVWSAAATTAAVTRRGHPTYQPRPAADRRTSLPLPATESHPYWGKDNTKITAKPGSTERLAASAALAAPPLIRPPTAEAPARPGIARATAARHGQGAHGGPPPHHRLDGVARPRTAHLRYKGPQRAARQR
nr:PhM00041.1 [Neoporphyra haitanensis]